MEHPLLSVGQRSPATGSLVDNQLVAERARHRALNRFTRLAHLRRPARPRLLISSWAARQMRAQPSSLDVVLANGELFLITAAISGAAVGELMGVVRTHQPPALLGIIAVGCCRSAASSSSLAPTSSPTSPPSAPPSTPSGQQLVRLTLLRRVGRQRRQHGHFMTGVTMTARKSDLTHRASSGTF